MCQLFSLLHHIYIAIAYSQLYESLFNGISYFVMLFLTILLPWVLYLSII